MYLAHASLILASGAVKSWHGGVLVPGWCSNVCSLASNSRLFGRELGQCTLALQCESLPHHQRSRLNGTSWRPSHAPSSWRCVNNRASPDEFTVQGHRLARSPTGANKLIELRTAYDYIPNKAPAPLPDANVGRVVARMRDLRISVKKLNVVAKLIRRMHIDDALIQLALVNRKAARMLTELLITARANAENLPQSLDTGLLVVDECLVLKAQHSNNRVSYRAKGRADRLQLRRSHLFVRLVEVPHAEMKTIIVRPWWERRNRHIERSLAAATPARLSEAAAEPAA